MGKVLASTTIELEGAKTIQFQPDNMEGVDSSNLYKICKGYIHDKGQFLNREIIPSAKSTYKAHIPRLR